MNALTASEAFGSLANPATEWLVLRCAPAQTLRIARQLAGLGAWVPTWKRMRRVPRATVRRLTTEACIPSFVFLPIAQAHEIPDNVAARPMRNADGARIVVQDRHLAPLRQIADKPLPKAQDLPKPGQVIRVKSGPFEGLDAKVITASQRYCKVTIAGFPQPIQMPPWLLLKN
jgi:transcription antitermination factor NusG